MEAYIALTKLRAEGLGAILTERLADALCGASLPTPWWPHFHAAVAEMDVVADWVVYCGTRAQKDAWIDRLSASIACLDSNTVYDGGFERRVPVASDWSEWIVWRAACTQDEHLVPALGKLRARVPPNKANTVGPFLSRAEAACGSREATAAAVRQVLAREAEIVSAGQAPGTGGITSLDNLYYSDIVPQSLRVRIIQRRGLACALFPMPTPVADATIRLALSDGAISDWYALYLLNEIKKPQAADRERLLAIWDSREIARQILALDVLYVWGDAKTLMDLYSRTESGSLKSEIAWALAALNIVGGAPIIEEQVRACWNPDWLALGRTFIHRVGGIRRPAYGAAPLPIEMDRNEQTLWYYFHPISDVLDDTRLALLKRLTVDDTIHAGMRFDLLGVDYGGTDWGLPLLEKAARDILATDSSATTVARIMSMMNSVGNSGFVINPASD